MTKREEQDFFVEKTVSPVVPFLLLFCSDAWIVASYSHLLAFLERSNRFLSPLCCKRHLKQNRVDGFFIFSCTLRPKQKKKRREQQPKKKERTKLKFRLQRRNDFLRVANCKDAQSSLLYLFSFFYKWGKQKKKNSGHCFFKLTLVFVESLFFFFSVLAHSFHFIITPVFLFRFR